MPPKFAILLSCIASLTFLLVGYDFTMPYTSSFFQAKMGITDDQNNWFVYTIDMYGVLGAFGAGLIANVIGRKYSMITAAALFFIGYALMSLGIHYAILMIGRAFVGIGSGISLVVASIYIGEASPSFSRESLTKCPELFLCFGTLIGIISHYFCSTISNKMVAWRLMMGLGLIPSSALLVAMLYLPESPTWLYMTDEIIDATNVLNLTSNNNEDEVSQRLDVMLSAAEDNEPGTWTALFSPGLRKVSTSIITLHFCQQVSGMEFVLVFSPIIIGFVKTLEPHHLLLVNSLIICIRISFLSLFTFLGVRIGRSISLLVSVSIAIICLVFVGVTLLLYRHGISGAWLAVGLLAVYIPTFAVMFSIGLGPVTWTYGIEILPYQLRSRGVSVGIISNRTTRALFLSLLPNIFKWFQDGGAFLAYGLFLSLGFIVCYKFYKDSSVRILEEVDVE